MHVQGKCFRNVAGCFTLGNFSIDASSPGSQGFSGGGQRAPSANPSTDTGDSAHFTHLSGSTPNSSGNNASVVGGRRDFGVERFLQNKGRLNDRGHNSGSTAHYDNYSSSPSSRKGHETAITSSYRKETRDRIDAIVFLAVHFYELIFRSFLITFLTVNIGIFDRC
ncbi:unnamed protein product [Gongylonema pulchrum]|uniref:Uncharacterized protein n=1 Tax=Gongylonema pulchrum TaxID=637853 RepID=A0A183D888_9BILA|nr:unnamed protein product [Gongylonema pulchrum]